MRQFRRPHRIPDHAHPLVRRLLQECNNQHMTLRDVSERAGLHHDTVRRWADKSQPRVGDLEAAFGVLGLKLTVGVKRYE